MRHLSRLQNDRWTGNGILMRKTQPDVQAAEPEIYGYQVIMFAYLSLFLRIWTAWLAGSNILGSMFEVQCSIVNKPIYEQRRLSCRPLY